MNNHKGISTGLNKKDKIIPIGSYPCDTSQEKIKVNPKTITEPSNLGAQDLVLSANDTKTPDTFSQEINTSNELIHNSSKDVISQSPDIINPNSQYGKDYYDGYNQALAEVEKMIDEEMKFNDIFKFTYIDDIQNMKIRKNIYSYIKIKLQKLKEKKE